MKDKIVYYIGIQGYFDYVIALILLEEYGQPQNIIFDKDNNIPHNAFYILSVIAIQQYDYLITQNISLCNNIDSQFFDELTFYSLRNSKRDNAIKYVEMVKSYMSHNIESLFATTNRLILPLSRNILHPLGVTLLHNYLSGFKFPAQRDLIWSVPIIKKGYGDRYYDSGQKVELEEQAYKLNELDLADGCPTIYAWVLSNVDNNKREYARTELMRWALLSPKEFYKLLVKFVNINDLQIKSDLFSILMCLMFELKDRQFKQQVTEWILSNILSKDKIDFNRNISIRYYCVTIVKKSIADGIIDEKTAKRYLPPYKVKNYNIKLNKEALAGTRMGGYKGISYDLSRYVLIDHMDSYFNSFNLRQKNQFEELLKKIAEQQPKYLGISEEQFILSATFQFITDCGWNEKEFDFYELEGNVSRGIDCLIRGVYYPATHGSQSRVMTVCEKYVWQARYEIMGFLADRIKTENDNKISYLKNYEILENYVIPMRNLEGIKTFSDDYWFLPEKDKLSINKKIITKDELITGIKSMPNIDWGKWIFINNSERKYKIESDSLIALNSYTSLDSVNYMDTVIAIETLLVPKDKLQKLINRFLSNDINISAPSDFEGDLDINCYISPKELCWFPWIKQLNDFIFDDKKDLSLNPTTVKCCANVGEDGETTFYMPSKEIRELLGIIRSDNYLCFDSNDEVKAEYYFVGDKYETHQEYLLASENDLIAKVTEQGKELVWILKEYRREDMKAKEKFGRFYVEKEICSMGYFVDGEFKIINISNENKI